MKKILIFLIVVLTAIPVFGTVDVTEINFTTVNAGTFDQDLRGWISTLNSDIVTAGAASGGVFADLGTGNIFYVDSATGSDSDTGVSLALAKATLDAAVALCTDGNHDVILVVSGHAETLAADVTLDIDDMTVIGIGSGTDTPEFTFDTATDEFIIDAQGVTVFNLRFIAGIAEVAACFTLADESDYALIIGCEFPEPGTATFEFDKVFQLVTGADNVTIAYNTWINQAATPGATTFIDGGAAAIDSLSVVGNHINADADVAALMFSDQADTNLLITKNTVIQEDIDQFCIELTSTATGIITDNVFANLGGSAFILDPGSCHVEGNMANVAINAPAFPFPTEPAEGRHTGTGNVYYVDSGTPGAGDGESWGTAVATLDAGVNLCTANRGDTIYVAAGHAETLGGAAAVDADIAGITIIGQGNGSEMPTFSYDTDVDTFILGADGDSVTIKNLRFIATVTGVVTAVEVEAGCINWTIQNCTFETETTTTDEFIDTITIAAAADRGTVKDCFFFGDPGSNAGPQSAINFLDCDYLRITGNQIFGDRAVACIQNETTASNHITIKDNILFNGIIGGNAGLNTEPGIELVATTTGVIVNNTIICNETTPQASIIAADCYVAGNTYSETESTAGSEPIGIANLFDVDTLGLLGLGKGKIIYCDSGESTGLEDGLTWATATDTIDEAIDLATASVGDVILVAPGHAENIASAAAVDADVIGLTIWGLGNGSLVPTLSFTAADGTVLVQADNVTFKNIRFLTSLDSVAVGVDIVANSDYATFKDCVWWEVGDNTGTDEFDIALRIGNACINTTIDGCMFRSEAAEAVAAISSSNDTSYTTIQNCRIMGDYSTAAVNFSSVASTDLHILDNTIINGDLVADNGLNAEPAIEIVDATGGFVKGNFFAADVATNHLAMTVFDDGVFMENYTTDDDGDDFEGTRRSDTSAVTASADG